MLIPWKINTVNQDLRSDNLADLESIQSMFCNGQKLTKELQLQIRPWETKDICVILFNNSSSSIELLFWFTEWVINTDWAETCKADMSNKNEFSKFIINNPTTWITLHASGTSIQKFKYRAPMNASWNILWCFAYQVNKEETIKEGNMFLIVPRKAGNIKMRVVWPVYRLWRRDDIKDNKDNILKVVIAISILWLIITIFQTDKKKEKNHK